MNEKGEKKPKTNSVLCNDDFNVRLFNSKVTMYTIMVIEIEQGLWGDVKQRNIFQSSDLKTKQRMREIEGEQA